MMNLFRKGDKTSSIVFQFTIWHAITVVGMILILAVTILLFAGYFLMEDSKQEITNVEKKIVTQIGNNPESFQQAIDDTLYPDYPNYFVKVLTDEGDLLAKTRGWSKEFEEEVEEDISILGFPHYMWNDDRGLFYRDRLTWNSDGVNGTILYEVELNHINEFLILLFNIFLVTFLISVFTTPFIIYRMTKRKLQPLLSIIHSVKKVKSYADLKEPIAVPDTPKELNDLAESINILLHRLGKQLEREKSFIANASHELRTPLTSFNGYINLIKRWGKDQPDVLETSIAALDSENNRMKRLLDQLMTLAKSEQIETQFKTVDLVDICKAAIQHVWNSESGIELVENYENHVFVKGDEGFLSQVVIILLDNAQRYSSEGDTVKIQLRHSDGHVKMSIADSGPGIPLEDQERVFERFYRVDKGRSREMGGTGLGLAIAKELVELHGGEISLESELGEGSTFRVLLPMSKKTN
ncbi:sensor histidine kinase [Pseudalkalibacillus sp. Hm43]